MKKISVIIPMYNSEDYIRQCIHSVTCQTYKNLEVLVIDDGSSDRGFTICAELAESDGRIKILRQENKGVSAARNKGIDAASGEYVFFLDSDDVIHFRLLEELVLQMEENDVQLAFCDYTRVDSLQMESVFNEMPCRDERLTWQIAEGMETEKWFHEKYSYKMSGIGGKMIRKDMIGDGKLRFDESLANGEDTFFIYNLVCGKIRAAYSHAGWYYYRVHPASATNAVRIVLGRNYFESSRRIRDSEWQKGRTEFASVWERYMLNQIGRKIQALKRAGDIEGCRELRKLARAEKKHPLFQGLYLDEKLLWGSSCYCYPLYYLEQEMFRIYAGWKGRITMSGIQAEIGILTFHCSDNFGAMLQAYALKTYLCSVGMPADVIRYDPPYMTRRHWFIPYMVGIWKKGIMLGMGMTLGGLRAHLKSGKLFLKKRANMRCFRERYLIDKNHPRLLYDRGLKKLPYQYYVVGSDQIWNPEITFGLREAYFGAFENRNKKRVVSYAASFGGAALAEEYDKEFSRLIRYVDAVSVREEEAIPYVRKFCEGDITAVLDPVFFLEKKLWQKLEKLPEEKGYIFVYLTERNEGLVDYVKKLSRERNLSVIEVGVGSFTSEAGFMVDHTAGPSEFLGYIHRADYVVSNSFHAIALSIIFHKKFLAFSHSNRGARLRNILQIHGLEDRLCQTGQEAEIDAFVDWDEVKRRTEEKTRVAGDFLKNSIYTE